MFKKKTSKPKSEKADGTPPEHPTDVPEGDPSEVKFGANLSRGLVGWLAAQNLSVAISTYQVGKIIFFGTDEQQQFWTYNRNVGRCLGMAFDQSGFWTTSGAELIRFQNLLKENEKGPSGADAYFIPRFGYYTGDLDIHDIGIDASGRPVFVNTLFNCLARPSIAGSFEPVWVPSFITRLAAEDRCHLNGLAMRDGKPVFVTAVSTSDVYDGWRDHRNDGGVVIDVESGETVCSGLSMPHSPRWHKGELWLHNSGTGEFGKVDLDKGRFEPVAFFPGYLRGLDFHGDVAVMGTSLPRDNKTFSGLPLDAALTLNGLEAKRGLYFVDMNSGDVLHSLIIDGLITEIYDVSVLPGVRKPAAIGPKSQEINRTISIVPMNGGEQ